MNVNKTIVFSFGAVVMIINILGLAYVMTEQGKGIALDRKLTPIVEAKTALPKPSNKSESLSAIDSKVAHLSHGIVKAMTEINALKMTFVTLEKKLEAQDAKKIIEPQLTQAEMQQQQAEAKQQYISNLRSVPRNEVWASQMEDEMLSSIESAQLNGFNQQGLNIQGIDCYSDNCLIDISLGNRDNESLILAMLPWAVTAEFIPSEDDALTGYMVISKI